MFGGSANWGKNYHKDLEDIRKFQKISAEDA